MRTAGTIQSVDYGSSDDLSCVGTTSENVKPADYYDRQTDHAYEAFLMPNKSGVPDEGSG